MPSKSPRVAVRAVICHGGRLLLVNAWPGSRSTLLCAPGGGVNPGTSLPENLKREVFEETGLQISVGGPCLINEFHDPKSGFHQVEVFFRCSLMDSPNIRADWQDPERIVNRHVWATKQDTETLRIKPDALTAIAFSRDATMSYDPLETIVS